MCIRDSNAAMKAATTESFGYNEDEIVSSDIVGMRFGSLFDATQTMVSPLPDGKTQVEVVSWYDNENSYVSQMVRTIKYFAELASVSYTHLSKPQKNTHAENTNIHAEEQSIFDGLGDFLHISFCLLFRYDREQHGRQRRSRCV